MRRSLSILDHNPFTYGEFPIQFQSCILNKYVIIAHILVAFFLHFSEKRLKRHQKTQSDWWSFNLTGDTFEIEEEIKTNETNKKPPFLRDEFVDDLGYFYDSAWTAESPISKKSIFYTYVSFEVSARKWGNSNLPERWLEIAVAVDHTVISFHGKSKVEQYVLALMNIVSYEQ